MDTSVHIAEAIPAYPAYASRDPGEPLARACAELFKGWGKDPGNPFGAWVGPGGMVVVKPNWVLDPRPFTGPWESLLTHPALIGMVLEWSATALGGVGRIVLGDAPIQSCRLDRLLAVTGLDALVDAFRARYPRIDLRLEDWRLMAAGSGGSGDAAEPTGQASRTADERYVLKDLGRASFLEDISERADRFRVDGYPPSAMRSSQQAGMHRYYLSRRVFEADLVVNLPKMKTHKRAGLTGAMKNLVGLNVQKGNLPHYIQGSPADGGDCYRWPNRFRTRFDLISDAYCEHAAAASRAWRLRQQAQLSLLARLGRLTGGDTVSPGGWSGNDTIWRTTLDLNHLLYFSPDSPRHVISIVDGIVAGEGDGPLAPTPRPTGLVVMGENPLYIDAVLGRLMGYWLPALATVHHGLHDRRSLLREHALDELSVQWSTPDGSRDMAFLDLPNLHFAKPRFWRGADASPGDGTHAVTTEADA